MTTETNTEIKKPKQRVFVDEKVERSSLQDSTVAVLNSPHLKQESRSFVERISSKLQAHKQLTKNEVDGLSKIQRGIGHASKKV